MGGVNFIHADFCFDSPGSLHDDGQRVQFTGSDFQAHLMTLHGHWSILGENLKCNTD